MRYADDASFALAAAISLSASRLAQCDPGAHAFFMQDETVNRIHY
jgi:hypothetical protein